LSENPEFKTIRNAVITAACELDTDIRNNLFPNDDEDDICGIDVSDDISLKREICSLEEGERFDFTWKAEIIK
ncbi:MAG: hypothetical protein IKN56_01880, partial [Clostridia bacterium]|nr:hypothetical protein [Clostridia bacterium]